MNLNYSVFKLLTIFKEIKGLKREKKCVSHMTEAEGAPIPHLKPRTIGSGKPPRRDSYVPLSVGRTLFGHMSHSCLQNLNGKKPVDRLCWQKDLEQVAKWSSLHPRKLLG